MVEYAPAKVKRTIAGSGRADKRQIQLMMRAVLTLDELPRPDAADALALAVTHLRLGTLTAELAARKKPSRTDSEPGPGRASGATPAAGSALGGAGRIR